MLGAIPFTSMTFGLGVRGLDPALRSDERGADRAMRSAPSEGRSRRGTGAATAPSSRHGRDVDDRTVTAVVFQFDDLDDDGCDMRRRSGARVLQPRFVAQIVAGTRQGAGPGIEAQDLP